MNLLKVRLSIIDIDSNLSIFNSLFYMLIMAGRKHYLNPTLVKSYMWQIMKSLDHMHRKGIFHRDIKPENILVDKEACNEIGKGLKLADFGSCRGIYSKQPYTEYISTRWYRAPECLLTDGYYGPEMDLWGAGCVMFEITSLNPLFPGTNEVDQINRIHKILGTPNDDILNKLKAKGAAHISFDFPPQRGVGVHQLLSHATPDTIDLVEKLLKYDASERISAREAMRHPYFKEMREYELKKAASGAADLENSTGGNSKQLLPHLGAGSESDDQTSTTTDKVRIFVYILPFSLHILTLLVCKLQEKSSLASKLAATEKQATSLPPISNTNPSGLKSNINNSNIYPSKNNNPYTTQSNNNSNNNNNASSNLSTGNALVRKKKQRAKAAATYSLGSSLQVNRYTFNY